jgi:hypothetical protein
LQRLAVLRVRQRLRLLRCHELVVTVVAAGCAAVSSARDRSHVAFVDPIAFAHQKTITRTWQ